jgi:hypothetical protein
MATFIPAYQAFQMAFHTEIGLLAFSIPEDTDPHSDGLYMVFDMEPEGEGFNITYYHSSGEEREISVPASLILELPNNFSLEVGH